MRTKTKVISPLIYLISSLQSWIGEHKFSWAVMPHVGHFLESDVPIAAHIFNSPSLHRKSHDTIYETISISVALGRFVTFLLHLNRHFFPWLIRLFRLSKCLVLRMLS